METKNFNDEKSLRIQELYEQSINKCSKAAKREKWITIPFAVAFACFLFFEWFSTTQPIAIRACGATGIMLLCFIISWLSTRFNSNMSKARDVNELLRVNDAKRKKYSIFITILIFVGLMIIQVLEKGGIEKLNVVSVILMVLFCLLYCIFTSRDCAEVREIKELMAGK